jgi:hypothetical protein
VSTAHCIAAPVHITHGSSVLTSTRSRASGENFPAARANVTISAWAAGLPVRFNSLNPLAITDPSPRASTQPIGTSPAFIPSSAAARARRMRSSSAC